MMTEKKTQEAEIALSSDEVIFNDALAATSRLATLGELTASIVHEINNPLLLIQGYADILSASIDSGNVDTKKFKKTLDKISDSVGRITKIVGNIRSFSRNSHEEEVKNVVLKDLVNESLDFCLKNAEKRGVSITVVSNTPELMLTCRPVQISQVIVNLINNAVDAVEPLNEKWVEINLDSEGEHIVINVTDSGNGIRKDIQEKIMKPFFTTKPVGKGTGLGLSISHTIIKNHNGKIAIDNACKNTRFTITLPKVVAPANLKSA
jgi:C4-dicarboxylate-specific signal transduction histidine kinase